MSNEGNRPIMTIRKLWRNTVGPVFSDKRIWKNHSSARRWPIERTRECCRTDTKIHRIDRSLPTGGRGDGKRWRRRRRLRRVCPGGGGGQQIIGTTTSERVRWCRPTANAVSRAYPGRTTFTRCRQLVSGRPGGCWPGHSVRGRRRSTGWLRRRTRRVRLRRRWRRRSRTTGRRTAVAAAASAAAAAGATGLRAVDGRSYRCDSAPGHGQFRSELIFPHNNK